MQQKLETTLADLVAIPSTSDNTEECEKAIDYAYQRLLPLGLHIERDTYNTKSPWLLATTQGTKTPDILLAAHLDVVPGQIEQYTLKKQDGKLVGRGVYDMKLAAACYLELFETHIEKLRTKNIGILLTTDEETGGNCMPSILEKGLRPGIVFIPDGGDDWHIEEMAKGFYGIELTAEGRWAHGSRPWEGDNALERLINAIGEIRHYYPSDDPMGSTLVVSSLHSGQAVNQVPNHAEGKLDFRSFSIEECNTFMTRLTRAAELHGVEIRIIHSGSPVAFDKHHPAAQSFLRALEQTTKKPAAYKPSFGGSDARYFAALSIPSIICEPTGGGRHADDEWLLQDDLSRYYGLIEHWLLQNS